MPMPRRLAGAGGQLCGRHACAGAPAPRGGLRSAAHLGRRLASLEALSTATHELVGEPSALTAEQEIRARALESAARLLASAIAGWSPLGVKDNRDTIARLWIELAQHGEAWVSTSGACGCTVVDDPECPLHGGQPRRRSTDR